MTWVEEIKQRLEKATPGTWTVDTSVDWTDYEHDREWYCWQTKPPAEEWSVPGYGSCTDPDDCDGHEIERPSLANVEGPKKLYPGGDDGGYYMTVEDAQVMAHAPTDLAYLLARLEEAEAVIREVGAAADFLRCADCMEHSPAPWCRQHPQGFHNGQLESVLATWQATQGGA